MSPASAADFLRAHFNHAPEDVQPIGRGDWSEAFAFRVRDENLVIRFGRHVEDFQKDQIASRFHTEALPIPKLLEIGEHEDAYYAISERAFGEMIDDLPAERWTRMVPSVMAMLKALKAADVTFTTGYGSWSPE